LHSCDKVTRFQQVKVRPVLQAPDTYLSTLWQDDKDVLNNTLRKT